MQTVRDIDKNREKEISSGTYRRIRHAASHLIGPTVGGWAVASREAARRRHFHFIGWIHRHGTHAAARGEVFLELERFRRALKWRWRINFADFLLHFEGEKWICLVRDGRKASREQNFLHFCCHFLINYYQNSIFTSTSSRFHFFKCSNIHKAKPQKINSIYSESVLLLFRKSWKNRHRDKILLSGCRSFPDGRDLI